MNCPRKLAAVISVAFIGGCAGLSNYAYRKAPDSGLLTVGKLSEDSTDVVVGIYEIDGFATPGYRKGTPNVVSVLPLAPGQHTITLFLAHREEADTVAGAGYFDTICESDVSLTCVSTHKYHFSASYQTLGRFEVRLFDTSSHPGAAIEVGHWQLAGGAVHYDH